MQPRRLPIVLIVIAAGAFTACSSGGASPAVSTAAGQPTTAATSAASLGPQASVDVGNSAEGLSNLTSYKIAMQITGSSAASVEAIVVNGATPARMFTETAGSTVIRIIEIGDDVWVDQGTGTYAKDVLPKSAADAMVAAFDPGVILTNMKKQPALAYLQNLGTEQKNGVSATHLHADQNTPLPPGASPIPAGAVADLWISVDGGYLVALEASGMGGTSGLDTITLEVTNINDPTLSISPPS
jgi:hypothetical protein